jgi:integrase
MAKAKLLLRGNRLIILVTEQRSRILRKLHKWLPERVYISKKSGAFEHHPKSGGSKTIAPKGSTRQEVLYAYERLFSEDGTISHLWSQYSKSERYMRLKPSTQRDYEGAWNALKPVFGKVDAPNLKPVHIRKYMDLRSSRKRANTERILMMNILGWGLEYNYLEANPVKDVKPFLMKPRDRYITDAEYEAFYNQVSPLLQIFMEFAYICAARAQDIRSIKISDITDDGLLIVQAKTGKKQIKLWNGRLRELVARARALRAERIEDLAHDSVFLIVTTRGHSYTADGLKSLWAKARAKYANTTGEEKIDWTFHDLKAKGISDFDGDKQNFSGHKHRLQMEKYNRSPDTTRVIDFKRVK